MFTQFSYANWAGNIDDHVTRKKFADDKLKEVLRQYRIIQPKAIVPFASYIWFCHEENFYLNDGANTIDFIYTFLKENTSAVPIVLYPADKWDTHNLSYDCTNAIQQYTIDWNKIMDNPPLAKTKLVEKEELINASKKFALELIKNNSFFIHLLKPAKIYIDDYNQAYKYSLKKGLEPLYLHPDYCDIIISSDALNYCFKYQWGGGTLRVNGRYQLPLNGSFFNFKMYFQISGMNNLGEKFDLKYIVSQVVNKIRNKFLR